MVKQGDGDPSLCAQYWRIEAPVQKLPKHQQICVDDGLGLTSPPLKAFSSFFSATGKKCQVHSALTHPHENTSNPWLTLSSTSWKKLELLLLLELSGEEHGELLTLNAYK